MAEADTPVVLTRQTMFWAATLAVLVLVFWLLRDILLPFVAGMVLAYLLDPLANRLERFGVNRAVATLVIVAIFVFGFILLLLLILPILYGQLAAFIERLPATVTRLHELITDPSRPWLRKVVGDVFPVADQSIGELVKQGAGWLTAFLTSLWSRGQALISIFSLVVVTPVVAFYMLYDWERMVAAVDSWVPVPYRETVRGLGHQIDDAVAGYLRGQSAVCLLLGSFYAVALTLSGLNFGLLIGLLAGIITFIPYVGSLTGLVLGVSIAIAQFWPDWSPIVLVLCIFLFGQFVEGYLLQPKLVGESVGLHPVWLMLALFAFGYLFGFVGLLIAVPLASAIGVLARFALRKYLASPFYTGESVTGPVALPPPARREAGE